MILRAHLFGLLFLIEIALAPICLAGNWPHFRGPLFNGSNPEESGLPISISKLNHVKWRCDLPGLGSSTPITWDNEIFITSANSDHTKVEAIKINIWTGQIEWTRTLSKCPRHDRRSDMATPSATTDGKTVIFATGHGDLVAYDFSGNELWRRNLQDDHGKFALKWTYSSSPILYDGTLYLQVLQRHTSIDKTLPGQPSYLLAIDPKTGINQWKHLRENRAVGESMEAYSSPIPINYNNRKEIILLGGDCVTGHAVKNGAELWRWGTWNRTRVTDWRMVSSPVFGDGIISICAPKGGGVYAFEAGARGVVNIKETHWTKIRPNLSCDVTTPLYYRGLFFYLNGQNKVLTCLDPRSGEIKWSEPLPARAKLEASPSGADGNVYLLSNTGEVLIVKAAEEKFELLHHTILGQEAGAKNRASIVPARGMLFIRIGQQLWCMD